MARSRRNVRPPVRFSHQENKRQTTGPCLERRRPPTNPCPREDPVPSRVSAQPSLLSARAPGASGSRSREQKTVCFEGAPPSREQKTVCPEARSSSREQKSVCFEDRSPSREQKSVCSEGRSPSREQKSVCFEGAPPSREQKSVCFEGRSPSREQKTVCPECVGAARPVIPPNARRGQHIGPNGARWCFVEHRKSGSSAEHPKRQIAPFRPMSGHASHSSK
jgi:hypothetical protein